MDQNLFKFDLIAEDPTTHARAGVLHTPHGDIETPIFMPVGTKQTSRAFLPRLSRSSAPDRARQYLSSVHASRRGYHRRAGRLHKFMNWHGPILTDSGGFQVFSTTMPSSSPMRRALYRQRLRRRHVFWTPEDNMESP